MPRIKKVVAEEPKVPVEVKEEPKVVEPVEVKEPEVKQTGHFYALKRKDGYVVVNRSGQVVSQVISEVKAIETAQRFEGLTR